MVDVVSRHDVRVLSGTDALQAYAGLIDGLACPPPQYAEWIEAWTRNVNPDLAVVSLQDSGAVLAVLPLEIVRKGPLKLAQFPGASHANGNFVPLRRDSTLAAADIEAMIAALRKARPDIDLIVLDRQLHQHAGLANPWESVPHQTSPNISLAVGLDGGFEALMARTSGKRKRKKQRAQLRKFEAIGPVRRWMAQTDGEVTQLLDFFFANKALRLKAMGVPNVFGEADVQAFFRALFAPQNRFCAACAGCRRQDAGADRLQPFGRPDHLRVRRDCTRRHGSRQPRRFPVFPEYRGSLRARPGCL